jgi:hypothetical protein
MLAGNTSAKPNQDWEHPAFGTHSPLTPSKVTETLRSISSPLSSVKFALAVPYALATVGVKAASSRASTAP